MRSSSSTGFTLVELLVVISIIGVLVGMLLPAVNAAREAARRIQCTNNLRQITIATNNYHSSHIKFPLGSGPFNLGDGSLSTVGGSWLGALLPFLEQENVANQMLGVDSGVQTNDQLIDDCHNFAINNPIEIFLCPSSTQIDEVANDPVRGGMTSHYVGSAGPSANTINSNYPIFFPRTSGSGPIGLNGIFSPFSVDPATTPPIYSNRHAIDFTDIRDGSSNTIAFGENSGTAKPDGSFMPHRAGWTFGANGIQDNNVDGYIPVDIYTVKSLSRNRINEPLD